ncbi:MULTISPECIES: extracellular solute-binding protein [unclassified Fibrobacter]|uniref:extracellular solute-binding protein n=1 Tax=unclassified Fibrobacter TaxID=2634177 RepID=UPI000D6D113F|nr:MULTISPECIES: extracellular solute-binding protein [unclassified Fibrobacter]PWJ64078.1 microcin C transport system substrate-binding protein [Fibrobacter sp. UWR4]PZW69185.1 microcin C transport system substrate-binding protein [Fibrobacter sp. UWR1]
MKIYKNVLSVAVVTALAFGLAACNDSKDSSKKNSAAVSEADCPAIADDPEATGEFDPIASKDARPCGAITLWGSAMPKSFNMWEDYNSFSAELMGMMYEPLVSLHTTEDREVGVLADSWTVGEDGRTFTFHVDTRAKWSDGKPVTAEDIQFYYDVIMDEKNLTPIFKVGLSRFDRPEVVDPQTIKMVAKETHWGNFWEAAGMLAFPKHVWQGKDFNQIRYEFPVVSGPYKIKTFREDRYVELARRADWWGFKKNWNRGKYNFQKIRYRFMNDQTKALEAFKKQDFNAYAIYTSSIWMKQTDFDAVQKGWAVKQRIYNKEPIGFQGMAINLRKSEYQDVRVRKALSLLMNREAMNEKYMYGQYFLLNSYYPDLWENNQNPNAPQYRYNPDEARALFAEAGYKVNAEGVLEKDGKPFKINFITSSEDLRHLTLFQEDLKKVGVVATIEKMSQSTLRKRLDDADFDLYWVNWGAGRLRDPEASWSSETANQKGTNNLSGLQDAVVDSLINLQKTEFDLAKRNEILKALDNRLAEIVPYVLMWQCDHHRILYWNRYGMPEKVLDNFNREDAIPVYWWLDPAKSAALDKAMKENSSLPVPAYDVK